MGLPRFAKILKYGCLAVVGLAAALAAIAALSSPATAAPGGGGGADDEYKWDTDNLVFSGYNARSFAIPHLTAAQRGPTLQTTHEACRSGVVDGFFQLDPSVRNDLPILEVTVSGDTARKSERAAATCTEFVTKQNDAVRGYKNNGGYYLDSRGILRKDGLQPGVTMDRSSLPDQSWSVQNGKFSILSGSRYGYRIDYYRLVGGRKVFDLKAPVSSFELPPSPAVNTRLSGRYLSWTPDFSGVSDVNRASDARRLSSWNGLCFVGFHPRGEDAVRRIGAGTGRTLSSLDQAGETALADRYWCRSDARKRIWYSPQPVSGTTCGTPRAPQCPTGVRVPTVADGPFQSYGRVGCYFTATGWDTTSAYAGGQKNTCSYIYPIPQCTENGTKKDVSRDQLDSWYSDPIENPQVFPFASDGSTECKEKEETTTTTTTTLPNAGNISPQLDFTADPCVTVILEIYENRVKGSNAVPGIQASHRTLAANPAYDLDVTSPHPNTASPPREPANPSGCVDGTEDRAGHGTAISGSRRNTGAGVDKALPTSSAADKSTHPPHSDNFASAGTDYTEAVKNIAHRFASDVAENTCAAKRAEAELVLSEMKARRLEFQRYIDTYESQLDSAIGVFGSYTANIQTGDSLGLKVRQYNATHRKPTPIRVTAA